MALLTEIHYFFIQSPLDIEEECSQTIVFASVKSFWCGFVSYSWKAVTVSSLTPDHSVDLRLGRRGWYLTFLLLLNSTFTPSLAFSLCQTHRLSFSLQFTPSDSSKLSPCLCAGCCCLVARSPSRSSDVVVVCLYWLECVTCICLASLEGVCFCSQCCKQGGAPFPNHSVGDGYFHRSYFFNHFGQ